VQPISVYYLTFTRLDGLLLGAFVALAMNDPALRSVLVQHAGRVIAAALLLLAGAIAMKKLSGFAALVALESAKYTLVALASGALLVLALSAPARSLLRGILESSALTFFGRYSYGLYLVHLPVISLLGTRMLTQPQQGLWLTFDSYVVISVTLSLLSWHLMEKPLLKLKAHFATT
jgi:peptidoglycan/LPS O-acetylase OafA/YrhL